MVRHAPDARRYKRQSVRYLENAYRSLRDQEPEKAGEFLWGSMAQAVKAAAATRNIRLRSHNQLREYANSLSKAVDDWNISTHFQVASSLHANFYETELSVKDVLLYAEQLKPTITKLLSLAPN